MIEFENHDIIIELTPEGRDGASVTARGEWEADEHYYYLDIVSYNGGSYLAKTDVPAGTLPTNTTYWQVVASNAHWGDITGALSDQEDLQAALDAKADADGVYTKTEADALLANKADKNSVYSKTEADALLAGKANASDVYTKTQVDEALDLKADKADSYTKDELDGIFGGIFDGIDNALDSKADADSVYTKAQTNTLLAAKANTADLGTMAGVNDAPSDRKEYARKNGQWAEVVGSGSTAWGEITGDLSDQTDLKNALDAKANTADLGALADQDTVDYETEVTNKPTLGTMSAESASDYYDKTEVNDLINASGVVAELDASGSIATFETNLAENLSRLSVSIDPVQDLHGYDNPWPAGGGSNIWNEEWESGYWAAADGTKQDGAAIRCKDYIPVESNTNYYFYFKNSTYTTGMILRYMDSEKNVISSINPANPLSITTPADCAYVVICSIVADGITTYNHDIAINYPSSVTTYSPYSNVCPISGHSSATVTRTGINIWDEEWEEGTISGSDGQNASDNTRIRSKNYISVMPSTQYYIHGTMDLFYYDSSKAYIGNSVGVSNTTFTASAKCRYIRFRCPTTYGTTYNDDISINYPATDTAYHAGHVQTVTIALGDTYYGAQLDAVAGTLTVTHGIITEDDFSTFVSDNSSGGGLHWADTSFSIESLGDAISSMLERKDGATGWSSTTPCFGIGGSSPNYKIRVYCPQTSLNDFKTAYADLQIVYELATPLTVQLTPAQIQALQGLNNVWADTGDVAVSYFNNSTAEAITDVKQMIASTETSMTATRNYTSGSLIIVGPALLKATSNISSGASLVIGTNCVRTALEEWILSLIA